MRTSLSHVWLGAGLPSPELPARDDIVVWIPE